jgi:hypothetical protein
MAGRCATTLIPRRVASIKTIVILCTYAANVARPTPFSGAHWEVQKVTHPKYPEIITIHRDNHDHPSLTLLARG